MNNQRKKLYISRLLQGKLILALVILEILLIAATMALLYLHFSAMLEHDLYAIHRSSQTDLLQAFAGQIVLSVLGLLVINTLIIFIPLYFWTGNVRTIVSSLRECMGRVARLQFSEHATLAQPAHELQTVLQEWVASERNRLDKLKQEIDAMEIRQDYTDSELRDLAARISLCKRLLEPRGASAN